MSKPRVFNPTQQAEGAVSKAPRVGDPREQARGKVRSRVEPSHTHQQAKMIASKRRSKKA